MVAFNTTPSWGLLQTHFKAIQHTQMIDWFAADPKRVNTFSVMAPGLNLDYSKNLITSESMALLCQLADECGLQQAITDLFAGHWQNATEKTVALHTALRQEGDTPIYVAGENIIPLVRHAQAQMAQIVMAIRQLSWLGGSGKPITDVVNIGVGGSDLGVRMATEALWQYATDRVRVHFVANLDQQEMHMTLRHLKPENTLFIVVSKSFSTRETHVNFARAKQWLGTLPLQKHCLAVTENPVAAIALGINAENILPLWPWVTGRYSIWSPVGLALAIAIGTENFNQFLAGGAALDQYFQVMEFKQNMPVILALLNIWYTQCFTATTQAVFVYEQALRKLVPYLQQLTMESNGKSITLDNQRVSYATTPILWGGVGSNVQHAVFQLLYQGTHFAPAEFVVVGTQAENVDQYQRELLINCKAQSQALMVGHQAPALTHQVMGNQPSNIIYLTEMSPFSLGALLALYEHKCFVEGVLYHINSFDQCGVAFAKQITREMSHSLDNC